MYKDKDKQKEAQRERTRRYREKQKGVTSEGVTQGVTVPDSILTLHAEAKQMIKPVKSKLTLAMVKSLPIGVSRPTFGTGYVRPDRGWWDGECYAGVIERLLTCTLSELKADNVWIPAWRQSIGENAPDTPQEGLKV
jgi:hypothetical protein